MASSSAEGQNARAIHVSHVRMRGVLCGHSVRAIRLDALPARHEISAHAVAKAA